MNIHQEAAPGNAEMHTLGHGHGQGQVAAHDAGSRLMMMLARLSHGQTDWLANYRRLGLPPVSTPVLVGSLVGIALAVIGYHVLPPALGIAAAGIGMVIAGHLLIPLGAALGVALVMRVQRGKARRLVLDSVAWRGSEQVLDVACGTGMLLNGCAGKLTTSRATGIDLWLAGSGGGAAKTLWENARAEGVADRVEVLEMDARIMTFESGRFDVVVSSFALHHIGESSADRLAALGEMVRVLKPGGRLSLLDIAPMMDDAEHALHHAGLRAIRRARHRYFDFLTAEKA